MIFHDRREAGRVLATRLARYRNQPDVVVLALPRGGVPVAFEVAAALDAPLDVFLVRKLGVPGHEELAMGAVAGGGVRILNHDVVDSLGVPAWVIDSVTKDEGQELERREREYRSGGPPPDVRDRMVIIIDDGLATGSTMRAAVEALRRQNPRQIVVAVPVAARSTCDEFGEEVDDVVCAQTPEPFYAVGSWYEIFDQTTDDEVKRLLDEAAQRTKKGVSAKPAATTNQTTSTGRAAATERDVEIAVSSGTIGGALVLPAGASGVVLFAHGSGSSRHSPRNQFVARKLQEAGLGTLLIDLLTRAEERVDDRTAHLRFDIELLSQRLLAATDWLRHDSVAANLPIGYFGASTGAAAALAAAAHRHDIGAVVSRGGRPDLADDALRQVEAAVMLIVGGRDHVVIDLNRRAYDYLDRARRREIQIVRGATHLFEEPGTLEEVARLAADWFVHELAPVADAHGR